MWSHPWGDEWGLTLRTPVQHLLSGSAHSLWGVVSRQSTTGNFSLCAGEEAFHCRLKGLLFWKIWTLEGKDLDL